MQAEQPSLEQADMQFNDERIGDFKTARRLLHASETQEEAAEEIERRQIIEFHEARLRWRLQRVFEDHRRGLPAAKALNRAGVKVRPRGFA